MRDCLIIGDGIIGLAIADELSQRGRKVEVIGLIRREPPDSRSASLAAAGILPPPLQRTAHDPLETIRTLSDTLFPVWVRDLEQSTNIDAGYRACGGLYIARTSGESIALEASCQQWQRDGVTAERIDLKRLPELEPNADFRDVQSAYWLPDEQIVAPVQLVRALIKRLERRDPEAVRLASRIDLKSREGSVLAKLDGQEIAAREIIVAAGPWSDQLVRSLGLELSVEPRRGQIAKWQAEGRLVSQVINEGPCYVVSRPCGEVIVGSTVEEAGFECHTTDEAIENLVRFARSLVPQLSGQPDEVWAGLRPFSRDGLPYIGRVDGLENLTIATGHFRSGIHLAPATAKLVGQLICGEQPAIDLTPYAARRI